MKYALLKILYPLSQGGNDIAYTLLNTWDRFIARSLPPTQLLSALANANMHQRSDDNQISIPPQLHDCDLRLTSLEVAGFRGVSHIGEDGQKFGISMLHSQKVAALDVISQPSEPRSIVVLGSNGSGKTSVYSALEYLWLNNTAIAKKHRYISAENRFYPNHKDQSRGFNISCHMSGQKKYEYRDNREIKINQCIDLSNFFCSESDISIIECSGKSIIDYFNSEIGISELLQLSQFLIPIRETQQENLNSLEDKIRALDEPDAQDIKKRDDLRKSITEINQIIKPINEEIESIRSIFYPKAQEILEHLLNEYDDGIVRPSFQQIGDLKFFNGMLEYIKTGTKIDPRTYFNNFRFKLYLVSIRIAIAFSIMKSKGICFPLVFDDIFDSSDFSNRLKAEPFFRNILRLYRKLEINPNPIQIIFFTQDEVIAESVYNGISEYHAESSSEEIIEPIEAIYCRLFNAELSDELDIVKFNDHKKLRNSNSHVMSEEETMVGLVVDEDFYSFRNLYDVIRSNT